MSTASLSNHSWWAGQSEQRFGSDGWMIHWWHWAQQDLISVRQLEVTNLCFLSTVATSADSGHLPPQTFNYKLLWQQVLHARGDWSVCWKRAQLFLTHIEPNKSKLCRTLIRQKRSTILHLFQCYGAIHLSFLDTNPFSESFFFYLQHQAIFYFILFKQIYTGGNCGGTPINNLNLV